MSKKGLTPEQEKAIADDMADLDMTLNDAVGLDTEPEETIYCPPDNYVEPLQEKGYKWDINGLYCPLAVDTDEPFYLRISRGYDAYDMTIGILQEIDNKILFDVKTGNWSGKTPITTDHKNRNQRMGQLVSMYGKIPEIADPLRIIGADLNGVPDFPQITAHFKEFQEIMETLTPDDADGFNPADVITARCNPVLSQQEQDTADQVQQEITEKGFIEYLDSPLNKIHIGDHRNIYRKTLMGLCIMRGEYSSFIQDIASAGSGKSHENDIVYGLIIPERYVMLLNDVTLASFTRYGDIDIRYLDRLILLFYDKGGKNSLNYMDDVLNILKMLITEGLYHKDLTEKDSKGNFINKSLDLQVDSIGAVYSTVKTDVDAIDDEQLESRSLKCTPTDVEVDDILDHLSYLNYKGSVQYKDKTDAEKVLKDFSLYLLSLVNDTDVILNPYVEIFKRHSKTIDNRGNITREFERQLALFNAYCRITKHDCRKRGDVYLASQKQVTDYFNDINLENALSPTQSDFINMIIKGDNADMPLRLINEDIDDYDPDDLNQVTVNHCINDVMEDFISKQHDGTLDRYGDDADITYDILNRQDREQVLKQLLKWYRLNGGVDNKFPVFFRVKDIHNKFRKYKAYKNISNISDMLQKLTYRGYANKLDKLDGENIYYMTTQCNDLKKQELTPQDIIDAENYLRDIGFQE